MSKTPCKIIIIGRIETLSPLHTGSGSNMRSDMDILLDNEGKPFIPATSFIGVLRSATRPENGHKPNDDRFWGFVKDKKGGQSAVRCSDLTCRSDQGVVIRDGVKISNKTGMAEDQAKYDYEILERRAVFDLNMEFVFDLEDEAFAAFVRKMAATIYDLLANRRIRIGAKTNNGLGEIRLLTDQTRIVQLDCSRKRDVFQWLAQPDPPKIPGDFDIQPESLGTPFETGGGRLRMDITLELKNSLIVRSYPDDPEAPDAMHIKSLDDWILPGSSFKGAIRARAERIVKTLGKAEELTDRLFGYVDKEKTGKGAARKGKVRVRETVLPRLKAEIQNRIKIDRFTGGTIEAALFDSLPLFSAGETVKNVVIEAPGCNSAEAGLLLLVLKDLWTGDLAVGGEKNVGRGVFKGVKAFIEYNDDRYILDEDFGKISTETRNALQNHVTALLEEN